MGIKADQLRSWISWAADIEDPETRRMLDWARERLASIKRALDPASFGEWLQGARDVPGHDPLRRYRPIPTWRRRK